jgi:outer membrane protein assembly factor BamB
MPLSEKESSNLTIAQGRLYVATASFGGDAPPYQGHLVVIDLAAGTTQVFNALCAQKTHVLAPGECPDNGAGIWARAGVVVDPATGHLFLTTGNGPFTANRGGDDWGESVLELSGDGAELLDSYTPADPDAFSAQDLDLGSSAPALLPALPGSARPLLVVQASKEGTLRLLDRQNLSGQGGPGHLGGELQTLDAPEHCPVLTQPVVWRDALDGRLWLFVANGCAIGGYQVFTSTKGKTTGKTLLREVWQVPLGATSPILAGVVLFAGTLINGLLALDARTGRVLWSSATLAAGGNINSLHWESPIVADGRLYCADESGQLLAYGLA